MNCEEDPKKKNLLQNLIKHFDKDETYKPASFFGRFYQMFRHPKRYNLFKKAESAVLKELDLIKYI